MSGNFHKQEREMTSQKTVNKVVVESDICGGCRSCELACSYHHTKCFQPSISSIQIIIRPKKITYDLILYNENEGDHLSCDKCKGMEVPLCVLFCSRSYRGELMRLIREDSH